MEMAQTIGANLESLDENVPSPQRCVQCQRQKKGHLQPYGKDSCQLDPIEDEKDDKETDDSVR